MTAPTWDVHRAELGDVLQQSRASARRPCVQCGKPTVSTIGRCQDCGSGIEQADAVYARILANCCPFSGLTDEQFTEHAVHITAVVMETKTRTALVEPPAPLPSRTPATPENSATADAVTGGSTSAATCAGSTAGGPKTSRADDWPGTTANTNGSEGQPGAALDSDLCIACESRNARPGGFLLCPECFRRFNAGRDLVQQEDGAWLLLEVAPTNSGTVGGIETCPPQPRDLKHTGRPRKTP